MHEVFAALHGAFGQLGSWTIGCLGHLGSWALGVLLGSLLPLLALLPLRLRANSHY
jgi:hypothetical protein